MKNQGMSHLIETSPVLIAVMEDLSTREKRKQGSIEKRPLQHDTVFENRNLFAAVFLIAGLLAAGNLKDQG